MQRDTLIATVAKRCKLPESYLKKLKKNINTKDERGTTLLHYAAKIESESTLASLVGIGCDWHAKNIEGETVLHFASMGGNFAAIKYFVSLGADIKATDATFKQTPLHYTLRAKEHFAETLSALIDCGADINALDPWGRNLLLLAVHSGRSREDLKEIVRLGGKWRSKGKYGCSVLHYAVDCGNLQAIKYFVSLGADVNSSNVNGETPLHWIVYNKTHSVQMLYILREEGAYINARDKDGDTVLNFAKSRGASSELMNEIVKLGGKL